MSEYIYQLVIQRGPRPGEIFSLNQRTMILGRDPMSDIVINDPEISRNHARLTLVNGGYEIQDMGSTNGTYIDGKRLRGEPMLLQPDMRLLLGSNVTLEYRVHEQEGAEVLETVLSSTEAHTPADGGTFVGDVDSWEMDNLSADDFEEAYPPAAPPTMTEPPADFEYEEEPMYSRQPAAAPSHPAYAQPTNLPDDIVEEKGESKTRNYILIGAGVGLFICCCISGLLMLVVYLARTQGIALDEFLSDAMPEVNSVAAVAVSLF